MISWNEKPNHTRSRDSFGHWWHELVLLLPKNMRYIIIALLLLGEALMIYAEVMWARLWWASFLTQWTVQHRVVLTTLLVWAWLLLLGYVWWYKIVDNIWIVAAISIGCILIVEPILLRSIFQELPTRGALIGLWCGIVGICFALWG